MTHQLTSRTPSSAHVEVVIDGARRPGRLHGIWRRGGQHVCEVSWRPGPGIIRIDTVSAKDVWVTPRRCPGEPADQVSASGAAVEHPPVR